MSSLYRREVNSVLLSLSIITYTCNYAHTVKIMKVVCMILFLVSTKQVNRLYLSCVLVGLVL